MSKILKFGIHFKNWIIIIFFKYLKREDKIFCNCSHACYIPDCTLTTGVVKEAWPLRKELDTDRLRPRAGSASSGSPAGGGRIEKEEDEGGEEV